MSIESVKRELRNQENLLNFCDGLLNSYHELKHFTELLNDNSNNDSLYKLKEYIIQLRNDYMSNIRDLEKKLAVTETTKIYAKSLNEYYEAWSKAIKDSIDTMAESVNKVKPLTIFDLTSQQIIELLKIVLLPVHKFSVQREFITLIKINSDDYKCIINTDLSIMIYRKDAYNSRLYVNNEEQFNKRIREMLNIKEN